MPIPTHIYLTLLLFPLLLLLLFEYNGIMKVGCTGNLTIFCTHGITKWCSINILYDRNRTDCCDGCHISRWHPPVIVFYDDEYEYLLCQPYISYTYDMLGCVYYLYLLASYLDIVCPYYYYYWCYLCCGLMNYLHC